MVLFAGIVLLLWLVVWPSQQSQPSATDTPVAPHVAVLPTTALSPTPTVSAGKQFLPAVGATSHLRLTISPPRAVVPGAELSWRGRCTPGAMITLQEEANSPLAGTICAANGTFTFSFRVTLSTGDHHLFLRENSNPPHQLEGMLLVDPSLNPPTVQRYADGKSWWLTGKAFPGTLLRVYSRQKLLGTATADENGIWRWRPAHADALAGQSLRVVGVGLLGKEGTPAPTLPPAP